LDAGTHRVSLPRWICVVNTAIVDPVSPAAPLEVILGRMYGQPIFDMPKDLYIPPDALEVILDAFEGPLDLLLYLIRKANIERPRYSDGAAYGPVSGIRGGDAPA
jgi:hypothetical protein